MNGRASTAPPPSLSLARILMIVIAPKLEYAGEEVREGNKKPSKRLETAVQMTAANKSTRMLKHDE